jgi:hypothetical protein
MSYDFAVQKTIFLNWEANTIRIIITLAKIEIMKNRALVTSFILLIILLLGFDSEAQKPVNWTNKQLIQPLDLANEIKTRKNLPLIFGVGPGGYIPTAIEIGMLNVEGNIDTLKNQLNKLPKNTRIVIYCGCCPYDHCPNVRPAIEVLKEKKFTNFYLLDLPTNIKKDWIEKGYPTTP